MELVFDRGTLLLLGVPMDLNLEGVGGLRWDGRVAAYRAPACVHAALCRQLGQRGVRFSDSVRSPVQAAPGGSRPGPGPRLRPYQEAALSAWQMAGRRGIVVLPTGSGKTRLAIAAIEAAADAGLRALCLVPTRVLLQQWAAELTALLARPVSRYGDGEREVSGLTVATFESAYRQMDRLGDRFDLLVVDEVHHFGGGLRDEALQMCVAPLRLGLTGTPPDRPAILERLGELVGPVVFTLGVADLAGTYLASFDLVRWTLPLDAEERAAHDRAMCRFRGVHGPFVEAHPQASWTDFVAAAGRTDVGRQALRALREAAAIAGFTRAKRAAVASLLTRYRGSRLLVFTGDTATAYDIARSELVMPLTAEIGRAERERVLQAFRQGTLPALVACRVLNEGLDVPEAEVAVITGGRLGEREHAQRIGRLLRPLPGKRALIYELISGGTLEVRQAQRRGRALGSRAGAAR